jgi:methylthioxylose transferase
VQATSAPAAPRRRLDRVRRVPRADRAPAVVALVVLVTTLAGLLSVLLGLGWGTPMPPYLVHWDPGVGWLGLPAIAVVALSAAAALRLRHPGVPPLAFAGAAWALALVSSVALSTAKDGTSGWYHPFAGHWEAKNEYLPALPALDYGAGWFMEHFADLVPSFPVHVAGHPPGLMLVLHYLGIDGPRGMAALVILAAALGAPLTYALGRALLDDARARIATVLWIFAPSALLYGATAPDALFATVGVLAAVLLVLRHPALRLAGAAALALASLFSYALLAIGAWSALVVLRREGARAAILMSAACAAALTLFYGALYVATGFDILAALQSTDQVYRNSLAAIRPYAFWVFGSPVAFLVALGLPLAWYAVRAVPASDAAALALATVIVIATVLGFTKAETERIWLMFVPLACVAAAAVLPARRLGLVLALLVAQAVVAELLFDTVW